MTLLDRFMMLLIALLPAGFLEFQSLEMQKQIDHLNSVTFESSRCPDSKSFSLLTLRP